MFIVCVISAVCMLPVLGSSLNDLIGLDRARDRGVSSDLDAFSSLAPLSLEELAREGISAQDLLNQLRSLARRKHACPDTPTVNNEDLHRHFISNRSVTCNDGSKAGYYLRKSEDSTKWLLFLEGGWFCFDESSCRGRWLNAPHLMTSDHWPPRRKGRGITSWDADENPYLYDANIVHVPYCSSDSWSGTYKATTRGEFSFMGALILQEVLSDLVSLHGMNRAARIILAGSSAGGTGVLVNLDYVTEHLSSIVPAPSVRGIADSGWFLDNEQYKEAPCTDVHQCAPVESIQKGIALWHGRVPSSCRLAHAEEPWRCYFGYKIYETMKTPIFIIQHLFDEAQITANNVGPPIRKDQWQYIHQLGKDIKRTLFNVSAVFAPACLSHMVLNKRGWQHVAIDGVTLPEAIKCWEDGQNERNHYKGSRKRAMLNQIINKSRPMADESNVAHNGNRRKKKRKNKKRNRNKLHRHRDRDENREENRDENRGNSPSRPHKSQRSQRSTVLYDQHAVHRMRMHDNQCKHHTVDHCAWPQCNLSCPKIYNPFTGEHMDFIDLLLQFGLDLSSIANALGMDLATLQTMDHAVLLQLLTRQS